MKRTLREKILSLLADATARRNQLYDNVLDYKEAEDYERAMICDIKRKQFDLFITGLNEALDN